MSVALGPRTYFLVDRVSKLVALVLVVASLGGVAGSFSLLLGLLGLVIGIATIFIEVEE